MKISKVNRTGKQKEAVIESKDQRWHCRNRVTLVFGSNHLEDLETHVYTDNTVEFKTVRFHQAKSKAIEEILDNCIDEFYRGHVTEIHTHLSADKKTVTIADNGIGFPLDKIKGVYTEFRTGSKFRDEDVDANGFLFRTLGQNGLGASATCLTSDEFKVTVKHYNSKMMQTYTFLDGALKVKKTPAKAFTDHSGVTVEFTLAAEVYKDNTIDQALLRKRIIDLAYNNPGLKFYFGGDCFHYKKGLFELAERINPIQAYLYGNDPFTFDGETSKGKPFKALVDVHLSVNFDKANEEREHFISFVNSTPTYDGGFHHDKVKRHFINLLKGKMERAAKKEKINFVDNDFLAGMTFVMGIIMPNPRFESQTKRKLVRDGFLEKALGQFMENNFEKFVRKNKEYMDVVLERAKQRHRFQELKEASQKAKRGKRARVERLLDANERKKRHLCSLFICEGESAIGGLRSSRNKLYQGGIALKGKPLNVAQATIKDVLANQELCDIMTSIGLVIGQKADPQTMRYSKIIFLADSDVDGGHINTLLTNFFFTFWPELFKMGIIQVAKAPLYEIITKDGGRIYAESPSELEVIKSKRSDIKEIQRNKGLGEMSPEAFKSLMGREDYTKITIDDMKASKEMLNICFGKETNPRKELLMDGPAGSGQSVASHGSQEYGPAGI